MDAASPTASRSVPNVWSDIESCSMMSGYDHVVNSPRLSLCFCFGWVKSHAMSWQGRRESLGTRLVLHVLLERLCPSS